MITTKVGLLLVYIYNTKSANKYKTLAIDDKYKLLQANPHVCKRLFGVELIQLEQVLEKALSHITHYLQENPLSKRGINAEFSVTKQLLLIF